jgi:hypothetical protein
MNSTKNLLFMTAIASFLVLGTSAIPMQSYAGEHTRDLKSSIKASLQIEEQSASQHLDQDNFCYRSDNCQQSNQAVQIIGDDNEAIGFNDQSDNLSSSSDDEAGEGDGEENGVEDDFW